MKVINVISLLLLSFYLCSCQKSPANNTNTNAIPEAPLNLTATLISQTQVDLSWTDKSTNEDGFKIERKTNTSSFTTVGSVASNISLFSDNGLLPNTTYTYRVLAFNSAGTSSTYSNEVVITTNSLPILSTSPVTSVTSSTAISGGNITANGGLIIIARGVVWSTSSNPTVVLNTKTSDGSGIGIFMSNISGLSANTTYFVRAYATTSLGTGYGNEVSFTYTGFWNQQGNKLVGTGAIGDANQGNDVSLSSDGNTAIVAGYTDNNNLGAAWIFTRTNGIWSQQGNKLVGSGTIGLSGQSAVSISADGNTAVIGGGNDNFNNGALWVFTRSNGTWSQQGIKIVANSPSGNDFLGVSVAMSADGNTIVAGGYNGNNMGGAWVFTRTNGVWSQQGNKLVGSGSVGNSNQAHVSISNDGNTFVIGGFTDNNNFGAAWVFTRLNGIWTQQGNKLVGSGAIGNPLQGVVSISGDGNTIALGGRQDNNYVGATWIFSRTNNLWSQQGAKLIGTGAVGTTSQGGSQGNSVSLSNDGNTLVIGGAYDDGGKGAIWVFTRLNSLWSQQGDKLVGTGAIGLATQGGAVKVSGDAMTIASGGYFDSNQKGAVWIFTRL